LQTLTPAQCAKLISGSQAIVVLSGAGVSTAAGIPDFRGPQGLYVTRRYDPELVFQIRHFLRSPEYFYEFTRDFAHVVKDIEPTFTHRFLAGMEQRGLVKGIVTQNIDILHQLAGNRFVLELHGSYRTATCQNCHDHLCSLDYAWWLHALQTSAQPPVVFCLKCGGLVKPDIVFFGEPVNGYDAATALVVSCDLLMVLGSSLNVAPASLLPHCTNAPTVVVNKGEVVLAPTHNRYFVQEDLDQYFREVSACLQFAI